MVRSPPGHLTQRCCEGAKGMPAMPGKRVHKGGLKMAYAVPQKRWALFSGSGVLDGIPSGHQGGDELAEEGPAAAAGVVHELEEDEVERQLLLRDAAVRSQPGAQQ